MLTIAAGAWSAYSVALLPEPGPDRLFDPSVRLPRHSRDRSCGRRHPRRDRHLARLDAGVWRGPVLEVLAYRRPDLDCDAPRHGGLRGARNAERRPRGAPRPAIARRHSGNDGRVPRPCVHPRLGDGLHELRRPYLFVGSEQAFGPVPVSFVLFLAVAIAIGILMRRTVFGRRCYAIGLNKEASWAGRNRRRAPKDAGLCFGRGARRRRGAGVDRSIRLGPRRQR